MSLRRASTTGAVVAVVVAVCAMAGCGSRGATSPAKVTVVLDWTPNTNHSGIYLAEQNGEYASAGIDIDIVEPDASGALTQLAAGNGDFAFSFSEQLLPARAQGAQVVSIAAVLNTNTSSLISPADRKITRPRELAGHTYASFGLELERPLIEALVRCDGGDPSKVRFVDASTLVDYAVGFRTRRFDVAWVYDGWDGIRLGEIQRLPVNTIAFRDWLQCIPDWYTPVIATRQDLIDRNPKLIRAFLAATAKGYQRAQSDPAAAAAALAAAAPESDRPLLGASARFLAPYLTGEAGRWGVQDPEVWEAFNAFLTSNTLPTPPSLNGAFTNEFLPR